MFAHFLIDPFFLGIVEDNGSPISYSDKSALEKTQKVGGKISNDFTVTGSRLLTRRTISLFAELRWFLRNNSHLKKAFPWHQWIWDSSIFMINWPLPHCLFCSDFQEQWPLTLAPSGTMQWEGIISLLLFTALLTPAVCDFLDTNLVSYHSIQFWH